MNRNKFPLSSVSLPLILALVCIFSMIVGMRLQASLVNDGFIDNSSPKLNQAIYEAAEHIDAKYYGSYDEESYTNAVISEMTSQLDEYSHYFEENSSERYDRYMNGMYRGLGLEFAMVNDSFFIFNVIKGSPAELSGVKRGEILTNIDSINLYEYQIDLDSLKKLSLREKGSQILLTTIDADKHTSHTYTLEVLDVNIPLLQDYIITDGKKVTSIIVIDRFYNGVFKDFMETIEEHKRRNEKVDNLIVDLRNNPGGVVEETVKMLNQFFNEKDKLLLSTINRKGKSKEYLSNGRSFLNFDRIAIICNKHSASASEIFAGVLQDYDKAIILGEDSFGKGLIQQNFDLSNKASINLSIGEYILPTGRHINPSSKKDSVFTSLLNERALRSERGIHVDIPITECPWTSSLDKKLKELVIIEQLWDEESLDSTALLTLQEALLDRDNNDNNCREQRISKAVWEISKYDNKTILKEILDVSLTKAYNAVCSDDYFELLGYKE